MGGVYRHRNQLGRECLRDRNLAGQHRHWREIPAYQLQKSNSSPVWSPDGKTLAFLSTRDDKSQIYVIHPQGGEAKALTKFETGVSYFDFSPNGKSIVFAATVPDSKAYKERVEKYSDYEVVQQDYKMTHLYILPVSDTATKLPTPKALTKGADFSVGNFSFSPDGTKIAFDAAKNPDLINSHTADIYVLTLADTTTRKIVSMKGPDNNPVWSPDGKQIAFVTTNEDEFFFTPIGSLRAYLPKEEPRPF